MKIMRILFDYIIYRYIYLKCLNYCTRNGEEVMLQLLPFQDSNMESADINAQMRTNLRIVSTSF
uniref:Uncharacterized protein n=1 Tax=Nelumbo nucifera TaxID=4432 RepID=A0A822XCD9_NELNU|nr:TPA_asm: hypothetical protein HUJ06_020547 [Nelumbo nucifera]